MAECYKFTMFVKKPDLNRYLDSRPPEDQVNRILHGSLKHSDLIFWAEDVELVELEVSDDEEM